MNIPGFNAEASLYRATSHYRMEANPNTRAAGNSILPQGVFCVGAGDATKCYSCDEWGCFQISGHGTRHVLE